MAFGKKSKQEKLIEEIEAKASPAHKTLFLFLDKVVQAVRTDVANFVPSIGNKSMSDIDAQAKTLINELQSSREFITLMKEPERKLEVSPIFKELNKIRPTRWDAEAFFAVQLIQGKAKFIKEDGNNADLVRKINSVFKWN